jgi:transcriptional regulator with XRE-family HTH domain
MLNEERQRPTHLNSIESVIARIKRGSKDRAQFVASHIDKGIAYQIRALRDRQELSQEELAAKVDMNQNAISRLESPERGRPTITTLKRLAEAFDVALIVRFVPFSKLVKWVSGTPFIEEGLSTESLAVPNFDEEVEQGTQNYARVPIFTSVIHFQVPALPLQRPTGMEWAQCGFNLQVSTINGSLFYRTRKAPESEVPFYLLPAAQAEKWSDIHE